MHCMFHRMESVNQEGHVRCTWNMFRTSWEILMECCSQTIFLLWPKIAAVGGILWSPAPQPNDDDDDDDDYNDYTLSIEFEIKWIKWVWMPGMNVPLSCWDFSRPSILWSKPLGDGSMIITSRFVTCSGVTGNNSPVTCVCVTDFR